MSLMLSQMALSFTKSVGQYIEADTQAKVAASVKAYSQTLTDLTAARAQNALVVNSARTEDALMQTQFDIERQSIKDKESSEVDAAIAGVTGQSVKATLMDLKASAGRATYAANRQSKRLQSELDASSKSIELQSLSNANRDIISKPSIGAALLGSATNMLDIYDSHQPEGSRLFGPNGGRVNSTNLL